MNGLCSALISILILCSPLTWAQKTVEIPSPNPVSPSFKADPDYNKSMQIDLFSGPLQMDGYKFDYEVKDQGRAIRIGQEELNNKNFRVWLGRGEDLTKGLNKFYADAEEYALYFYWPESLMQENTVEAINKTGQVLWKFELSKKELTDWQNQLQTVKDQLSPKSKILDSEFFQTRYALWAPQDTAKFLWRKPETFRFCFSQKKTIYRTSLCTPYFKVKQQGSEIQLMTFTSEDSEQKVLINNEEAELTGQFAMDMKRPILFHAQLASGMTMESINLPQSMDLYDVKVHPKNPQSWLIRGIGTRPLGIKVESTAPNESGLTKLIGFQSTIGDKRDFWQAEVSKQNSSLYIPGESGVMFLYPLKVNWLPEVHEIPQLKRRTQKATYAKRPRLSVKLPPGVDIPAHSGSLKLKDKKARVYDWYFNSPKEGQINRTYLDVTTAKGSYRGFYELYRGYSTEVSARLTGILATSGSYVFMGELAFNHWFERLFDWDQYYLSTLRWGVSAKVFQTFSKFNIGTDENDDPVSAALSVATFDIKYRLTPGLWGRDETWGLMLSLQSFQFNEINTNMVGGGVFWARSMPRIFDEIFNLIPYMNYPKWVDLEFIAYPLSMNKNVKLSTNYAINFHGKVMWSDHFFGEAGFGLKSYALTDNESLQEAKFGTFYGAVGLGWNF